MATRTKRRRDPAGTASRTVYFPSASLLDQLEHMAKEAGCSLNALIVRMLDREAQQHVWRLAVEKRKGRRAAESTGRASR